MSEEKLPQRSHVRSLFDDPERSRILWHDVKKTGAAFWLGLESFQEGVFGPVPPALEKPLADMRALAQEGVILFDDLSLLAKLRFGLPRPVPEKIDQSSIVRYIAAQRALTDSVGLSWRCRGSFSLSIDPSYAALITANCAWLCTRAAHSGASIDVKQISSGRKIRLAFTLSRRKKSLARVPRDLSSLDRIFSADADPWGPLRLPAAVLALCARACGGACSIAARANALDIIFTLRGTYEKNQSSRSKDRAHR